MGIHSPYRKRHPRRNRWDRNILSMDRVLGYFRQGFLISVFSFFQCGINFNILPPYMVNMYQPLFEIITCESQAMRDCLRCPCVGGPFENMQLVFFLPGAKKYDMRTCGACLRVEDFDIVKCSPSKILSHLVTLELQLPSIWLPLVLNYNVADVLNFRKSRPYVIHA